MSRVRQNYAMDATKFIGYLRLYLNTGSDDNNFVTCLLTETRLRDINYIPELGSYEKCLNESEFKLIKGISLNVLNKYLRGLGFHFDTDNMNRFTHADLYTNDIPVITKDPYIPPFMRLKDTNNINHPQHDKNHINHSNSYKNSPSYTSHTDRSHALGSPNLSYQAEKKYERFKTSLFSKINENILLDNESWYSVTPEVIAKHIADRMQFQLILDGFCGSGGNLIQFALNGSRVIAVDRDRTKISHATHNLGVYGVRNSNVTLWNVDFEAAVDRLYKSKDISVDCVFLDPPWGGMDYYREGVFDLDRLTYNLSSIYNMSARLTPNVIFKFPRKTNICQIASLLKANGMVEVEKTYLNGRLKFLILYFGQCIHEKYAKLIPAK